MCVCVCVCVLQRSLEDLIRSRVLERITDMFECDDEEAGRGDDQNSLQQIRSYSDSQAAEITSSAMNRIRDPEKKLAELFYQIDKDNSGFLTRCVFDLAIEFFPTLLVVFKRLMFLCGRVVVVMIV